MPRAEWSGLSEKQRARFLDFHIKTTQNNSGVQQYGAGQSMTMPKQTPSKSRSRNAGGPNDLVSSAPTEISEKSRDAAFVVPGDEMLFTLGSSDTFVCVPFQVNPGLETLFPWLANYAKLYQKYRFRKLTFYWKPMVSQYDPRGSTGKVGASFDLDAASANLTAVKQVLDMQPHVDGMPYENLVLNIDCSKTGIKFVRTGPVPAGSDIKTYDLGMLYYATWGIGATEQTDLCELHASYIVEFYGRVLPGSGAMPPTVNYTYSRFQSGSQALSNNVWTNANAIVPSWSGSNGLALPYTTTTITFPPGVYMLVATPFFTTSGIANQSCLGRLNNATSGFEVIRVGHAATGAAIVQFCAPIVWLVVVSSGTVVYNFQALIEVASGTNNVTWELTVMVN